MESEYYKGYEIEIEQDDCPESPREWDNLGTMICFHSRYMLGDRHVYDIPKTFENHFLKLNKDKIIVLPLYLYDHSGLTMNTTGFSCPRDSGQVGWIYVTYEKIRSEYSIKRVTKKWIEKITQYLINEVKIYDDYLRGDVYRYSIDGEDYMSGYYGYDHEESGLLSRARSDIDYIIEQERKEKQMLFWSD